MARRASLGAPAMVLRHDRSSGRWPAGLWALGFVMHLMVGLTLPWIFYGFMGLLMTGAAFSQEEGRGHLRRDDRMRRE